jgi:hypothetical protein
MARVLWRKKIGITHTGEGKNILPAQHKLSKKKVDVSQEMLEAWMVTLPPGEGASALF